jgi:galactose mutarotase-like enzyme
MTRVRVREHRGWDLVVLESELAAVEIVPGKGGDVLRFRWLEPDVDVLWASPWGLRHRGAPPTPGASADTLMDWYPGGWQVMLPNGGDEVSAYGTTWGMHGEVWTTPFDVTLLDDGAELTARLKRAPIEMTRRFELHGGRLTITEHLLNRGRWPIEGVYGHHPAFAPGFAAGGRLTCGATDVVVDDRRVTDAGDLEVGGEGPWPHAPGRGGEVRDLRDIPTVEGPPCERMAYLTGFRDGWAEIASTTHPLTARLRWDADLFPHAWLWTEYHASPDFPWFGAVDAIAIEPCTGFPAQGREVIAERTGLWRLDAGEEQTTTISLEVQEQH